MKTWHEVTRDGNAGLYGDKWITAAAILIKGKIHWHARHHLIIREVAKTRLPTDPKIDFTNQGFRLNDGTFIDRDKGLELAKQNGQFQGADFRFELQSEDLWKFVE